MAESVDQPQADFDIKDSNSKLGRGTADKFGLRSGNSSGLRINDMQMGNSDSQNMFKKYYQKDQSEDNQPENSGNNNESLDAVNISTPGTNTFVNQGRPQTSHGRVRKQAAPVNGIVKREEKHSGLGETSIQNWDENQETDLSKKQIMREKKNQIHSTQQSNVAKSKQG